MNEELKTAEIETTEEAKTLLSSLVKAALCGAGVGAALCIGIGKGVKFVKAKIKERKKAKAMLEIYDELLSGCFDDVVSSIQNYCEK